MDIMKLFKKKVKKYSYDELMEALDKETELLKEKIARRNLQIADLKNRLNGKP